MKPIKCIIVALLVLCWAGSAWGQTEYPPGSGTYYTEVIYLRDSGDGTAPNTTAGALNATMYSSGNRWDTDDEADALIGLNDCVVALDDDGDIRGMLQARGSGTLEKPIILRNEEGVVVTINGSDIVASSGWVSMPTGVHGDDYESGAFSADWASTAGTVDTWANHGISGPTFGATYGLQQTSTQVAFDNVVPAVDEYYVQFDARVGSNDAARTYLSYFGYGGTKIIEVMYQSNAAAGTCPIRVYNSTTGAQLGVGSTQYNVDSWHTVRVYLKIGASTGECRVWVDDVLQIAETGQNLGTNQINRVTQGSTNAGQTSYFDNFTSGSDDLTAGPRWAKSGITTTYGTSGAVRLFEDTDTDVGDMESDAMSVDSSSTFYLDDTNDLLYFRATDDATPSTHILEITERGNCYDTANGVDYIYVDGLTMIKSKNSLVNIGGTDTSTGNKISNCTLEDSGYAGVALTYDINGVTIEDNTITRCHHSGLFLNLEDAGNRPDDVIIRRNKIWNCWRQAIAVEQLDDGEISSNVMWDINADTSKARLLEIFETDGTLTVTNNTGYDSEEEVLYIEDFDGTVNVNNNIWYNADDHVMEVTVGGAASTLNLDYNCYYQSTGTMISYGGDEYTLEQFATYQSAKSQDANGIAADPLFVSPDTDDFTLQPGSPCINAGKPIVGIHDQATPATDFAGESVYIVNIGAYGNNTNKLYFNADAAGTQNGAKNCPYSAYSDFTFGEDYIRDDIEILFWGDPGALDLSSVANDPTMTITDRNRNSSWNSYTPHGTPDDITIEHKGGGGGGWSGSRWSN